MNPQKLKQAEIQFSYYKQNMGRHKPFLNDATFKRFELDQKKKKRKIGKENFDITKIK